MEVKEIISLVLIIGGVIFMMLASIGMIRLPDFYIRNSASTKAATLGLGLILLGAAVHYNKILVFLELLAISLLIFLITPLAAHIVARAAYKTKVPFWHKTDLTELRDEPDKPPLKQEKNESADNAK